MRWNEGQIKNKKGWGGLKEKDSLWEVEVKQTGKREEVVNH